jgi:hypothetical protein
MVQILPTRIFLIKKGIKMNIETARGIAARIWCDPEFSHITMDIKAAEEIAQILLHVARMDSIDKSLKENSEIWKQLAT